MSSGSSELVSEYLNAGRVIDAQHTGQGDFFLPYDTNSISKEYLFSAQQNLPENLHSDDLVKIVQRDDTIFKRTTLPVTHFFALEKSMYQTISEEMLKLFATLVDFNNLIGEPVNRYRQDYKMLGKLRQLYFEKYVDETGDIVYPDFEKFVDYYKWIDSAVSHMIYQLVPGSSRFGERLRNIIESHILERNKYWNKFPTLEFTSRQTANKGKLRSETEIEGIINETKGSDGDMSFQEQEARDLFLSRGSSPVVPQEGMKKFGLKKSDELVSSGDATIDAARQTISDVIMRGRTTTPYRFGVTMQNAIRSGVNRHLNQKPTFVRNLIKDFVDDTNVGLEINNSVRQENNYDKAARDLKISQPKQRRNVEVGQIESRGTNDVGYTTGINNKFIAPFSLYSSSVETGYNSILVSELTGTGAGYGVDFANLHQDVYGPHYETPLQGPLTEKWVGGMPYRHVTSQLNYNGDLDDRSNRLEGWLISFENDSSGKYAIFQSPTSASAHNPRSMYWKGAKRPVNIENIRTTTGSGGPHDPAGVTNLGNYSRDYEIVQTSGRVNNRSFVKDGGNEITWLSYQKPDSTSLPVQGVTNYTALPRTSGKNKYIFVERFSAPGGPEFANSFMDLESGELSPYNALPYRNLLVRTLNNELLTNHTKQFGYYSDTQNSASYTRANVTYPGTSGSVSVTTYESSASYHSVNRNPRHKIKFVERTGYNSDGGAEDFVTGTTYDNYWVQHAIPRSDGQYSWISASATSPIIGFSRPNHKYASKASDDITFLTSSLSGAANIKTDFNYLNTLIYEEVEGTTNTLSASTGDFRNTSIGTIEENDLNSLLLNRQGPYGWPTWKQIRGSEHPVTRGHNSNNTSSLYNDEDQTRYQYNEAPVSSKYHPLTHILGDSSRKPVVIRHTYGNNLSTFSHVDLNKKLKYYKPAKGQTYDKIKAMYLGANRNEATELKNIYYKETIWPREVNTYLSKARGRKNYVVNFWRDDRDDRKKTSVTNSQNNTISKQSIWPLDARIDFATASPLTGGSDGSGELQNNYVINHGGNNEIIPGAIYARPISSSTDNLVYGDTKWEAGSQAGKNPFYDSYSDYSDDIRRVAKDYSVIPEFRISDSMAYYLDEKAENFFVKDHTGSFSLTGSDYTDSSESGFFKTYMHSDFLKHFGGVYKDHEGNADPSRLTLSCKAVKKFIAYDGFYPASRTLQLANLFSASYTEHGGITDYQRRIALTPFFAPGILYNTIKSGIAVDWPVYTSDSTSTTFNQIGSVGNAATSNVYRLTSSFSNRIPFDGLIHPEKYLSSGGDSTDLFLYESEPNPHERYSTGAATTGSVDISKKSKQYELAMHNFLAESINFFLKDSSMTNIHSALGPHNVDPSKSVYKMRIVLADTSAPSSANTTRTFSMYNRASAFGPAVDAGSNSHNYTPYTPPYYNTDSLPGYAHVEITFTPFKDTVATKHGTEGLSEYDTREIWDNATRTFYRKTTAASTSYDNMMHITASINIDGVFVHETQPGDEITPACLVIEPRFETPILNFNDVSVSTPTTGNGTTKGMWHQYGTIETDDSKGIFLGIVDSPTADSATGSLASLLGFKTGLHRLGQLPLDDERTMKEAVVAIPIIKKVNKKTGATQTNFIAINTNKIKKANNAINQGQPYETVQKSCAKSVYDMVAKMKQYVIPPRFDFITKMENSEKAKAFSMYIFEFEHNFSRQDVADIWQNLPPDIGNNFELDENNITHKIEKDNLLNIKSLKNPDLHWIVFKVKQKAKTNYFSQTSDYLDDTLDLPYSYNWPYDFCSLVELAKIDTEVRFDKNKERETETDSEKEIKDKEKNEDRME